MPNIKQYWCISPQLLWVSPYKKVWLNTYSWSERAAKQSDESSTETPSGQNVCLCFDIRRAHFIIKHGYLLGHPLSACSSDKESPSSRTSEKCLADESFWWSQIFGVKIIKPRGPRKWMERKYLHPIFCSYPIVPKDKQICAVLFRRLKPHK